jgi:hypothetical protein
MRAMAASLPYRLSIPGCVPARRPVLPVNLGHSDEGVVSAFAFVLSAAACVLEASRASPAGSRCAAIAPRQKRLTAVQLGNDAGPTTLAPLVVEVLIEPARALHPRPMEGTALPFVVKKRAAKLTDPEEVPLLQLVCFSDSQPAELSSYNPTPTAAAHTRFNTFVLFIERSIEVMYGCANTSQDQQSRYCNLPRDMERTRQKGSQSSQRANSVAMLPYILKERLTVADDRPRH